VKNLDTLERAQKELEGDELVSVQAVGKDLLKVQVVRYNPRTENGKFHQYHDYLMPLEVFKAWSVDFSKAAATCSPT
jgi:hypothetical protein